MEKEIWIYPCTRSGKILKGFCPTVCTSLNDIVETVFGLYKHRERFGINYYFDGYKVVSM